MAGRIPQSFIDDLLNRVDIVEVIDARVPLKKAGHEYKACCPFHGEKTPSFTVSANKQFYHCFGCGAHGTALGFVMEYDHLGFPEAVEELARSVGMQVPHEEGKTNKGPSLDPQYELMDKCDRFFRQQLRQHAQSKRAVDYLKGRGLSGEIAAEFGLGFAPPGYDNLLNAIAPDDAIRDQLMRLGMLKRREEGGGYYDFFRDRIMFPIRDKRGRTIAFGGRVLGEGTPKYLNSPETLLFHKGRELYGLYEARKVLRHIERLLVVEGYMDVVALAQFDIRNAVATLGTATTPEHLGQLFRVTQEVVFCFDGDRAGRQAAWRALENSLPVIKEGLSIRFLFLPEGEDPDTLVRKEGKEAFLQRVQSAMPFSEYFFSGLRESINLQSMDGRAQLFNKARPLVNRLSPGVYREMMVQQLANLASLPLEHVESHLRGEATTPTTTASVHTPAPGKRPSFRQPTPAGNRAPSLVRTAFERLLHQPQLGLSLDLAPLREIHRPGMDLFLQVLETIQQYPHLRSAAIIERWRDTEHYGHLQKLMTWEPPLEDPERLAHEFQETLRTLETAAKEDRTELLLTKSREGQLSDSEKAELKQLLKR